MMRRVFDEQLDKLNIDLTKMGHLVEVSIENMIDAFKPVSYTHLTLPTN